MIGELYDTAELYETVELTSTTVFPTWTDKPLVTTVWTDKE